MTIWKSIEIEPEVPKKVKHRKDERYSKYVLEQGLHLKRWLRLDDLDGDQAYKVWRMAKFLTPTIFMTRQNHKRGATLYHICAHFPKLVIYCKFPKNLDTCQECDTPIDEGVRFLIRDLQQLKDKL